MRKGGGVGNIVRVKEVGVNCVSSIGQGGKLGVERRVEAAAMVL